jgi:Cellulase (glycosyl hydrolase family 5)
VLSRLLKPALAACVLTACVLAATAPIASAQDPIITVEGNQLLRDGVPWTPRGVQIVGLVAPTGALSGKYIAANQHFGVPELQAAIADHADVVRFQVSEFGLDPQGPLYSSDYVQQVQSAVQAARSLGLAVIISLQAEPPAGEPSRCPLPDAGAQDAWNVLAPMFAGDGGVMFELYNEPAVSATPAGWIQWRAGGEIIYPSGSCQAVGMPALIADIRTLAPQNVIIVPGLGGEQSLSGRVPLSDPAHPGDPQLAYGIHYPSLTRGSPFWDKTFGDASAKVPVIVTEWDANSTTSCVADAPGQAQLLLDYLASKRIGIVGFAFDLPGTIVADWTYAPTSYDGFTCGVAGGGPGQLLFGDYEAEALAGYGSRPDPSPAWIVSAAALARLQALNPGTVQRFFDTPRTYVTGAGESVLAQLGTPAAVPTAAFASETTLAGRITRGTLAPGTGAVLYAPGATGSTPRAQQHDPAHYYELAAQVAHAHGLLLIAAPAMSLVPATDPLAPPAARDAAFLRLGIVTAAARYADVFDVPAARDETYAAGYASFARSAAAQATRAHPGIELIAGLSSPVPGTQRDGDELLDAYLGTRLIVSGYALDAPGSATAPALAFLGQLDRLNG